MEKRFTSKDLTLLALLTIIFLFLLLTMYQIDRQWSRLSQMERLMTEQAQQMRALRNATQSIERRLGQGVALTGQVQEIGDDVPPSMQRAAEASEKDNFAIGDSLALAFGTGLATLTPIISSDANASEVQAYVVETLLQRDPETLEWIGHIARDWDISDDGLTINFQLREDVTFSDGEPLTADDVQFTHEFIMDERIAAPRLRAFLNKIESVTALGDYEVEFQFAEPYFNSLALAGGVEILARHFYEPFLERPDEFNESRGLLFGSGPYRLPDPRGWSPDQGRVELERNPRYWGPVEPALDRIMWRVIENDAARLTTFRNGEIDVYGARPREYEQLQDDAGLAERTQNFEYMSPVVGYSWIGWNQERNGEPTRFADRRVRQAMTYLTDQARIIEEILLGYAEPAVSPFNPRSAQHNPDNEPYPYDPDRALELLAQAGFADRNGDGVLEDEDGQPFRFSLVYFQDNEDTSRTMLLLRDIYARAGIDMQLQPTEWSVMLDLLDRKDFDAITLAWTSGVETDIYQMFHSSQIVPGGDNFIHYRSPQLDNLIEEARSEVEEELRMPIWQQAEDVLYEDQPYTFLYRRETLAFIDQRIQNLEITNLGLNLMFVPVEIYVPGPQQQYTP